MVGGGQEAIVENIKNSNAFKELSLSMGNVNEEKHQKVSFFKALMLPRVMLYSSAFFCTKMAVFCLLLILPTFLKKSKLKYEDEDVANVSTLIDLGAMFGSMTLGYLSDRLHGKRSPVALMAVFFSMALTYTFTFTVYDLGKPVLFIMMFFIGFFISGLNNMISASCSADLGKQEALKGNSRAISTVTGIIDGTGTMGSAAGQLIVGYSREAWGW
jgi:sugar phosphate permease